MMSSIMANVLNINPEKRSKDFSKQNLKSLETDVKEWEGKTVDIEMIGAK